MAQWGNRSDWRYLGGTSRRFVNTDTGETVSRRQFEQHFGRPGGELTPGQTFERLVETRREGKPEAAPTAMGRYNQLVSDWIQARRDEGQTIPLTKAGKPNRAWARSEMKREGIVKALRSEDNSPTGKKAQALRRLGRKKPSDMTAVGETPD